MDRAEWRARRRAKMEQVDHIRRRSNPVQNHVIDELQYGKITRREFLRRGSLLGLSFPVMGVILSACGEDTAGTTTTAAPGATTAAPGGTTTTGAGGGATTTMASGPVTVRTALPAPAVGIDPVLINDEGGLAVFGQAAEYLVFSDDELNPVPVLAESWEPSGNGDVWTFHLNPNATFHDGSPVTAEDVVATVQGIAEGNAGPAFETFGVDPGAVVAVDPQTVEFTLTQPNGAFPFFMSSDNYNAAILPASFWAEYTEGSYEQSFIGSGPWINESFDPGVSAVYVKNEDYWGDNSGQPDRMEITFFADEAAAVTGFQEGRIDTIPHISYSGATALLDSPDAAVTSISTAQHRQVYFDTSAPPFDDARVRQAIALTLNRPTLIEGLLGGFGVVGNDHPIWENYPMYNPDAVEQREEDLATAQQLLEAAGYGDGLEAPLDTLVFFEVEDLATLIAGSAAQVGVTLNVGVYDSGTYYGDYWLAAANSMGIVNYGHRGVPNVYLGAPLLSPERLGENSWNASHWTNPDYDALFDQFVTSGDLDTQRQIAGEIQTLLNEEVPFIVPYYVDHISVSSPNFSGLEVTGMGHYSVVDGSFSG
ncbi:MAG TPA: ABC transporter substrate-binding protein [Acidimicrobiia bacterium]|nr:ABC transporter substrate-binding protein [Acidimicrobiia bacterium]